MQNNLNIAVKTVLLALHRRYIHPKQEQGFLTMKKSLSYIKCNKTNYVGVGPLKKNGQLTTDDKQKSDAL